MNTRLLTSDGFPRSDIDVAQSKKPNYTCVRIFPSDYDLVRTTRARIIYLRNDYKTLMNAIEKVIHEHFATLASEASEATAESTAQSLDGTGTNPRPVTLDPPFAKVNTVQSGSPADAAGLKAGDRIRNFGYVDLSNHNNLSRVAQCVQGNEGVRTLLLLRPPFYGHLFVRWTNSPSNSVMRFSDANLFVASKM
jgi:26S proteasome non-ATPase regulatory subunit 9